MRFFTSTATVIFFAVSALAAVTPVPSRRDPGDRYVVRLKSGADKDSVKSQIPAANGVITHDWDIIYGFGGTFDDQALEILRSNPSVQSVEKDLNVSIARVQKDAPWGLQRISNPKPIAPGSSPYFLNYSYDFPKSDGRNVDIYIVDTGVRVSHKTFEGRAIWGATFGGYADVDGNGHGTHVAGTAAGFQYGVAKGANIIAVKVLSDFGDGSFFDVIDGLQWVKQNVAQRKKPSVVNMSLIGGAFQPVDDAVQALTSAGIHVVVAAGNVGSLADFFSPARAPTAVTVAATDITDTRPFFSNTGSAVKLFAPGVDVFSAYSFSDTANAVLSGTSMASPHVAGIVAYLISTLGDMSTGAMINKLQGIALKDVVKFVPPDGTPNLLAQNK